MYERGYQPTQTVVLIDELGNKTEHYKKLGWFDRWIARRTYKRKHTQVFYSYNSLGDSFIY